MPSKLYSPRELANDLNKIGADLIKSAGGGVTKVIRNVMLEGANDIRNTIIKSMRDTNRNPNVFYRRGKKKHNPSSPGNPPAIDTGELVKGVLYDIADNKFEVGDIPKYGEALETAKTLKHRRPHIEPAYKKHEKGIIDKMQEFTGKEIESSLKDNIK